MKEMFKAYKEEVIESIGDAIEKNGIAAGNVTLAQLSQLLVANREEDRAFLKQMLEQNGVGTAAPPCCAD